MDDSSIEVPPTASEDHHCSNQLNTADNKSEDILLYKRKETPEDLLITEVELILDEDSAVKKKPPLFCELCPSSTFSSQSKLNDHMLKHTGERPFKCSFCDKSYPVKGNSLFF